jgi:hypothetical protein
MQPTKITEPKAYFSKDKEQLDPIHMKPGVFVDLMQIDPNKANTLTKIKKDCEELAHRNTPKDLRKKYQATTCSAPLWLGTDNNLYQRDPNMNHQELKGALGQIVLAYLFPVDTPQTDIDKIVQKHKLQSHQPK